jgi:hypothetical protein
VDGFVEKSDPRLEHLAAPEDSPIGQVWLIGSYAVPLTADELAPDDGSERDE